MRSHPPSFSRPLTSSSRVDRVMMARSNRSQNPERNRGPPGCLSPEESDDDVGYPALADRETGTIEDNTSSRPARVRKNSATSRYLDREIENIKTRMDQQETRDKALFDQMAAITAMLAKKTTIPATPQQPVPGSVSPPYICTTFLNMITPEYYIGELQENLQRCSCPIQALLKWSFVPHATGRKQIVSLTTTGLNLRSEKAQLSLPNRRSYALPIHA
jgi:hypothetical protein